MKVILLLAAALFSPVGQQSIRASSGDFAQATTGDEVLSNHALFERSLRCYEEGIAKGGGTNPDSRRLLLDARDGFGELVRRGVSNGRLYFNIANADMHLGELGRAILNYRRAMKRLPGDAAIRHNLDAARKLRRISFDRPATHAISETLFVWHFKTSAASRLRFAMAGYGLFWLAMLVNLKSGRRPALMWTAAILGLLTAATGGSVAYEQAMARHSQEGVITQSETVLRKGNGDYYDPALVKPLPEGVEFRVLSTREDVRGSAWYQIELPDGKEGWLQSAAVDLIG